MDFIPFFIIGTLIAQAIYYFLSKEDGSWIGWTLETEAIIFYFEFKNYWLSLLLLFIIGYFLHYYVDKGLKFLPEKINKILYYPKLKSNNK